MSWIIRLVYIVLASVIVSLMLRFLRIPPVHDWKKQQPVLTYEPHRDKTNKMAFAPSKDSDQSGNPLSLIRVFAIRLKKARSHSYPLSAQRILWSDWADVQADLSLRWAQSFCWFGHDAAHMYIIRVNYRKAYFIHHHSIISRLHALLSISQLCNI